MSVHTESRFVPAPPHMLFDLVADVERYPAFLPMWKAARIRKRESGAVYYTEQRVGIGPINERFTTRTVLGRPAWIEVTSSDRLFREFFIRWHFAPAEGGCRVGVELCWQVRSRLLQQAIDLVLPKTTGAMIGAFEHEAKRGMILQRAYAT
ncbi:MAG: type II toxin-antitoxin system RatA family toxin [Rhodospirillales bacterium]|nr:MAG: type II toxin-antitoxin system RatA family toxin [Rhodospirillales bacterium]